MADQCDEKLLQMIARVAEKESLSLLAGVRVEDVADEADKQAEDERFFRKVRFRILVQRVRGGDERAVEQLIQHLEAEQRLCPGTIDSQEVAKVIQTLAPERPELRCAEELSRLLTRRPGTNGPQTGAARSVGQEERSLSLRSLWEWISLRPLPARALKWAMAAGAAAAVLICLCAAWKANELRKDERTSELARVALRHSVECGKKGRYDEAKEFLNQALVWYEQLARDFPTEPAYQAGQGRVLDEWARLDRDRKDFKDLRALQERIERAGRHHCAALVLQPGNNTFLRDRHDNLRDLAEVQHRRKNHRGTAQTALELSQLIPRSWKVCCHAAEFLADCVTLAEDDGSLSVEERQQLTRQYAGRASELLQEALRRGRSKPVVLNQVAWFLVTTPARQLRDGKQALALATQAVEREPLSDKHWHTLALAHYRVGNRDDALKALEKSMQLCNGGDSFDWFLLAMIHKHRGNDYLARDWFAKAVVWMDCHHPRNEHLLLLRAEATEVLGLPRMAASRGEQGALPAPSPGKILLSCPAF